MAEDDSGNIVSKSDYKDTPSGWHRRWQAEINNSLKQLEDFHEKANKVVARYTDDRHNEDIKGVDSRINSFWSNTQTLEGVLYANPPTLDVKRTFDDPGDDVGRVAAHVLQRVLKQDLAGNGKEFSSVIKNIVFDRLVPGLGAARLFYEFDEAEEEVEAITADDGTELAPAYTETIVSDEKVSVEYFHWGDVCWSWSRTWGEVTWVAFRSYMTKDEIKERFGSKHADQVQLKVRGQNVDARQGDGDDKKELWQKAEVWEIWDKESSKVFWYSKGSRTILDKKDDPLGLRDFFPCPQFWLANKTTSKLVPKPDFCLYQDLLNEIDILQTRISILTEAVKVVGVYDSGADGVARMLTEGTENDLIPVDSWAAFAEKGGIQGSVDWLPVEQVVNAIEVLSNLRDQNRSIAEGIIGINDIISGTGTHPREGVGTQEMKAEFGSVRIQKMEEELAAFVTDVLELKAEIICKHCTPETILDMAQAQGIQPADMEFLEPAVELLKDWDNASLRVTVRSYSMAMVDYARMRRERTEYISNIALFMQSAAPIIESAPQSMPILMEMLKWGMAGFRGSNEIEGVLDKAIEAALKQPAGGQDDGEAAAEQAKQQGEIAKEKVKIQGELTKIREKVRGDLEIIQAKFQAKMMEILAKSNADESKEAIQAQYNALEAEFEAAMDMRLKEFETSLEIEKANDRDWET